MIAPWILGASAGAAMLSVIVLAACRSSAPEHEALIPEVLAFEVIGEGVTSGVTEPGLYVLRDQAAFDELWRKHTRLQLPTPPTPEVDFDDSMVVATFAGQKATGGYSVQIDEVSRMPGLGESTGQIVVRTTETVPEADGIKTQMTTAPFQMVRVQRCEGDCVHAPE